MKRTHLPLNALRVFEAAARHLSFTRAADELAVTPAAVGQQIRALEETLGVVLFRRLTRNLELTHEAEQALPALQQGFLAFEEAVRQMQAGQSSRVLSIAAPRALMAKWLTARLADYGRQNPDLRFSISAHEDGEVDFTQANLDLALYFGSEPQAEGIHGRTLGPERLVTVAAPGAGTDAPCIAHPLDPETPCVESALTVADPGLALDAAASGLGKTRVPALLAAADLAAGRLVALDEGEAMAGAWWLTAPTPQWRQAKVRALVAFLIG
ncbi:LysR substrate-binding domain-containing protein [Sandarakinorhabdus oryzae]|uniref:LysR substrate-binding domain-containing protein n=1 Tax=Sandarakinorhabdus oryzae TaxID=2675220 RepID=UPI0012E2E972|nr:LysR substrate-binding domain-containing protein [Sandarakinorhabdus oryzae]